MDEEADPSDHEQHDYRKLVEGEGIVDAEIAGAKPGGNGLNMRDGRQGRELRDDPPCHRERCTAKGERHGRDNSAREPLAEQAIDRGAGKRQQRYQPKMQVGRHSLSRFTWSIFNVSRVRNTAIMMASPTAASAAATTITKNTN